MSEKKRPLYVSEEEVVELMNRAAALAPQHYVGVQCHFGPGWAALDELAPDFQWVGTELLKIRGALSEDAPNVPVDS